MNHSTYTHLGGSLVLFGVAPHLPDGGSIIAALAALGLFFSGLASLLKQVLETWRATAPPKPAPPASTAAGPPRP